MGVIYIKEEHPFAEFVKGVSPAIQAWGQREKEFSDLKNAALAKTQYSNQLGDMMGGGFGYGEQVANNPYDFQSMQFNPQQPESPSKYRPEGFTPQTFAAIADAYAPQNQSNGNNVSQFGGNTQSGNSYQIQLPTYQQVQQVQNQAVPGFVPQGLSNSFKVSGGDIAGLDQGFANSAEYFLRNGLTPEEMAGASLTSGYRDPQRNADAGGVPTSYHLSGRALDMDLSHLSPERRDEIVRSAKEKGFNDAMYHDVGSGYHLHLGGENYQEPPKEGQMKQTINTTEVAKWANIDLPQMTPKPKMKQQIKKQFYEDQRAKLNDKNLSRAERSAMARQVLIGDKEFDEQFEAAWEVKATEAMDEAYNRLQPYLTHPDRRTALLAAQAYDGAASKLGLKLPKMREFVNDLNPGEKIMPYDDGATTGFQAYNPMTGEIRVLSSMGKKLSPSDQQRQSNWEADYQYRMGRDNEDREVKRAQLDANQKNQRMTQINNALKLLYVKDPMGNYVPMSGREQQIKELQDEYLMLNGVGIETPDQSNAPQYGTFSDYQNGKPTLSPEQQQKEDEWQGKNRSAFKQGFNSLYPLYLSGQDSTLIEQQWRQYAYSIGVDPEPAIQAAKSEADKGKRNIHNPRIR